jgi:hypothetical protein
MGGERSRTQGLLERATFAASGPVPQWLRRLFSVAAFFAPSRKRDGDLREGRFTSRIKIAGFRHPPLRFGRFRVSLRGAGPDRPPLFVAMKAAMGAVNPTKGSTP